MGPLRVLSYLAPSIPEELFVLLAERIEAGVGIPVRLDFETRVSGPAPETDPFAQNRADLAFVCAPSYPQLRNAGSPVVLLPVAPVFADPRAGGRPLYFSDVIVRTEQPARDFAQLRGTVWSYNDRSSRSGWQNMIARLLEIGQPGGPGSFFRDLLRAGSHVASIGRVAAGEADAASIDSNTLWLLRQRRPTIAAALRIIESWGPTPIQPVLAHSGLDPALRARIAETLLTVSEDRVLGESLAAFGLRRFASVDERDYAEVRPAPAVPAPYPS